MMSELPQKQCLSPSEDFVQASDEQQTSPTLLKDVVTEAFYWESNIIVI